MELNKAPREEVSNIPGTGQTSAASLAGAPQKVGLQWATGSVPGTKAYSTTVPRPLVGAVCWAGASLGSLSVGAFLWFVLCCKQGKSQ